MLSYGPLALIIPLNPNSVGTIQGLLERRENARTLDVLLMLFYFVILLRSLNLAQGNFFHCYQFCIIYMHRNW